MFNFDSSLAVAAGQASMQSSENMYDVMIIGAGITGIYQLYKLKSAGFRVGVLEAAPGVGGTWFWNRYPGARFDIESYTYAYFFSPELFKKWEWSEHFAGQPEIERYLNMVVDDFDLRHDIRVNARVQSAFYDAENGQWEVTTEDGVRARTRFVVASVGLLSEPQYPPVSGREEFRGLSFHTARWPWGPVEFADKRVAVIGTGSSGVQVIQTSASEVSQLFVFQRTAHWASPLNNAPITPDEQAELQAGFMSLRDQVLTSTYGSLHEPVLKNAMQVSRDERLALFEKVWSEGGFAKLWGNYRDIVTSQEANDAFCKFAETKIRARIDDSALADKLIPKDHGYGVRRPPYETNYYETYNRDNVTLVDLQETPFERITAAGVRTVAQEYDVDIIVYATGFDVATGSFNAIDFRGVGDRRLSDAWADGPRTYLGVQTPGFPNLFLAGGPHTITVNLPRGTESQVDFIAGCLDYMRSHGYSRVECDAHAAEAWTNLTTDSVSATLLAVAKDWAFGANTPGKKRVYLQHAVGLREFVEKVREVAAHDYEGLIFSAGS